MNAGLEKNEVKAKGAEEGMNTDPVEKTKEPEKAKVEENKEGTDAGPVEETKEPEKAKVDEKKEGMDAGPVEKTKEPEKKAKVEAAKSGTNAEPENKKTRVEEAKSNITAALEGVAKELGTNAKPRVDKWEGDIKSAKTSLETNITELEALQRKLKGLDVSAQQGDAVKGDAVTTLNETTRIFQDWRTRFTTWKPEIDETRGEWKAHVAALANVEQNLKDLDGLVQQRILKPEALLKALKDAFTEWDTRLAQWESEIKEGEGTLVAEDEQLGLVEGSSNESKGLEQQKGTFEETLRRLKELLNKWKGKVGDWQTYMGQARVKLDTVTNTLQELLKEVGTLKAVVQNVIIFGSSGVGKSSIVNLLAGKERGPATTGNGANGTTFQATPYPMVVGGVDCVLYDTAGLDETDIGKVPAAKAVAQLYDLMINKLKIDGKGLSLLVFCVRAGRISKAVGTNWKLFVDIVCQNQVPVCLAITGLEDQEGKGDPESVMKSWWDNSDNKEVLKKLGVSPKSESVACITATKGKAVLVEGKEVYPFEKEYDESRKILADRIVNTLKRPPWTPQAIPWMIKTTKKIRDMNCWPFWVGERVQEDTVPGEAFKKILTLYGCDEAEGWKIVGELTGSTQRK